MTEYSMNMLRLMLMRRMNHLKTGPAFLKKKDAPAPILIQPLPYMCASIRYAVIQPIS